MRPIKRNKQLVTAALVGTKKKHGQTNVLDRNNHIRRLFKSILVPLLLIAATLSYSFANAAPQLVTPQLPPGVQGQAYTASLLIGSVLPVTSASASGLPAGLTAIHNGSGSIAISGSPTASGSFTLNVTATDNAAGTLSTNVSLTVNQAQGASTVSVVAAGHYHS